MLARNGIAEAGIFYSPVQVWLYIILMMTTAGIYVVFAARSSLTVAALVLVYRSVSYLLYTRCSNSFAVRHDTLYIINPSHPFRKFKVCALKDIRAVTFDEDKKTWINRIFLLGSCNDLLVETGEGIYKYACAGLDLDAFDEGFTEKNLDDLRYHLEGKGLRVNRNLLPRLMHSRCPSISIRQSAFLFSQVTLQRPVHKTGAGICSILFCSSC